MLQLAGVQLVPFSPLHDSQLPPGLSGVLLGGGAVAQHAAQLSCNSSMLEALRAFAGAGGLVIGEAGGLLYLSQSLQWQQHGQRYAMGEFVFPHNFCCCSLWWMKVPLVHHSNGCRWYPSISPMSAALCLATCKS